MFARYTITANQGISLEFTAIQLWASNLSPNWMYIRVGANDQPSSVSADLVVPPYSVQVYPIPPTRDFGVSIVDSSGGGTGIKPALTSRLVFYDNPLPSAVASFSFRPPGQWVAQSYSISAISQKDLLVCPANQQIRLYRAEFVFQSASPTGGHLVFGTYGVGPFVTTFANPVQGQHYPEDFSPIGVWGTPGLSLAFFNTDSKGLVLFATLLYSIEGG
jgi:hypothetical protein